MRKPKLVIRKYRKMQKNRQEFRKEKSMEITNNRIHLCQSCHKEYPNCDANNDDIVFGDGIGNDNICCCNKYLPLVERDTEQITTKR